MAFCWLFVLYVCCLFYVANLLWNKIFRTVCLETQFVERIHQKKANPETLSEIWFVTCVSWLTSSVSSHDIWNGVSNSHIFQINESGLELTTDDQSLLETLETLCGSASTRSKLVNSRIKENFVSIYVFKLS